MSYSKYQQATINHVCSVFSYQDAYLVADEVGLGKTYVAKGVIQKLYEQNGRAPMRVIYVASNQIIAKTNAKDLGHWVDRVTDIQANRELPYDRLSALGGAVALPSSPAIQIYAFSPNTTFTGRGSTYGNEKERRQLAAAAPEKYRHLAQLVASYASPDDRTREMGKAIATLREVFNDIAISKINPDLIVLDEFHRFHTILSPQRREGEYSFHRMLAQLNRQRERQNLPHVKILLLSATPYRYNPKADEIVHTYELDERQAQEQDPTTAFDDFKALKEYIRTLNGTPTIGDTVEEYFRFILCRTQRDWLCSDNGDGDMADLTTFWRDNRLHPEGPHTALWDHMAYSARFLPRLPRGSSSQPAQQSHGFGTLRAYLDEAPEYPQFSDGYRSVQTGIQETGAAGTSADKRGLVRDAYCNLLTENGQYLLRKSRALPGPDWTSFVRLQGHYKWESLKRFVLPTGCEYCLWATPITLKSEHEYAKTVVFAHYRLSTRAVAALVSMEIEKRLHQAAGPQLMEQVTFDAPLWESLLAPFQPLLAQCPSYEGQLKRSIAVFFNTTHARRVLTAFALQRGLSLEHSPAVLREYCGAYLWPQAIREYLACLFKFSDPAQASRNMVQAVLEEACSVLCWDDRDFTRVLILPDWKETGYSCSFGERYTIDYSDKSAHDDEEKSDKQSTTKRLEHIRDRFQSPFYPFVLAASETAQEGVNLHNYCQTLIHWSVPSNLNSFVQEEGRVNRRGSWILRKQLMYLIRHAPAPSIKLYGMLPWHEIFAEGTAAAICKAHMPSVTPTQSGLFPLWYLPIPEEKDVPRLRRMLLCMPLSREVGEYERLFQSRQEYGTFGVQDMQRHIKGLCPYLVYMPLPLFHGTNQYALNLSSSRRMELAQACECVLPYLQANDAGLRRLRDQSDDPALENAFVIWEAISRGSTNFEYGSLYLTLSRNKAEHYSAFSYPCGERSFCVSQLLLALAQLPHPLPPATQAQEAAGKLLLKALEESRQAKRVLLTYDLVPLSKIQACEDGGIHLDKIIRSSLKDPELAQHSFRVDGSVFPTASDVSLLPG